MPTARAFGEGNATTTSTSRGLVRGDATRLWLVKNTTQLSTHELGFDVLERKYRCHRTRLAQFLPRRGDVDFEHQKLAYWSHSRARKGELVEITVRFNGYLEPRERVVVTSDSTSIQELPVTNGAEQLTLVYQTSRRHHRYANPVRPPDSEPFAARVNFGKIEILAIKGSGAVELETFNRAWLKAAFGLVTRARRVSFDRNLEGAVWMCEEVIENQLVQQKVNILV
jgi:hypothetical protein